MIADKLLTLFAGILIAPPQRAESAAMSHTSIANPWDLDHYEPPVDEDEIYLEALKKEDVKSMKSGSSRHSSALGSSRDEEQEGSSAVMSLQPNKAKEEQKFCPDCHLSLRRPKVRPSSESRTNTSHTEEEEDDDEDVCICTPCKLCNKNMCGLATKKMKDPRRADELRAQIHSRVRSSSSSRVGAEGGGEEGEGKEGTFDCVSDEPLEETAGVVEGSSSNGDLVISLLSVCFHLCILPFTISLISPLPALPSIVPLPLPLHHCLHLFPPPHSFCFYSFSPDGTVLSKSGRCI